MAITPKSKGLGNIGSIVNRQGRASPTKPVTPVAKPVVKAVAKPVAPKVMPKQAPKAQIAKTVKPNPFTANKAAAFGVDSAPIQGQQRNPITGVIVPKQPGATQPAPGKTNPMVPEENPNPIDFPGFFPGGGGGGFGEEYIMPGDPAEYQRQVDMWNNSDLAKQYNDYETNQRQLGGQAWGEAYKSVMGPNWNPEYNAEGNITNLPQDYNQHEASGKYYQNLVANDPRFKGKMFGQEIGADAYFRNINSPYGSPDYYSRGLKSMNPELYESWMATQRARPGTKVRDPIMTNFGGGQQGPSTMESPRGPDGRYLYENMLGVGGMFGGQQGQGQVSMQGLDYNNNQNAFGSGGPTDIYRYTLGFNPSSDPNDYSMKNKLMSELQGQGYDINNPFTSTTSMFQGRLTPEQYNKLSQDSRFSFIERPPEDMGIFPVTAGGGQQGPGQMFGGNNLQSAFNPTDKNQYNGGGFMSGNSGSLFGGGGFAGK